MLVLVSRRHACAKLPTAETTTQEQARAPCIHYAVAHSSSKITIFAAIAGNCALAVTKFIVAAAALLGLLTAFLGIYLGHRFGSPYYDGAASVVIGVILCAVALVLVYESRGLLIGESADPAVTQTVRNIAAHDPAVAAVRTPLTMHLGPDEILLNLEVEFRTNTPAEEHMRSVVRIEDAIRSAQPAVKRIFIEARPRNEHSTVRENK